MKSGINIDLAHEGGRPSANTLTDLGIHLIRFSYKPDIALSVYRDFIEAFKEAGIESLVILGYETVREGLPAYDAEDHIWTNYLGRLTKAIPKITRTLPAAAFQIWNEPDHGPPRPGYDPRLTPTRYADLLNTIVPIIRQTSDAKIIGAGLVSGHPDYWVNVNRHLSTDGLPNAIAVHPYARRPTTNWPNLSWGVGTISDLLIRYNDITRLPIWVTEVGTDTTNEDIHGEFPKQTMMALSSLGFIEAGIYFCYSDAMVPKFGITDTKHVPKPAYHSLKRFTTNASKPPDPGYLSIIPVPDLPKHPQKTFAERPTDHITMLTVHHSATTPAGNWPDHIKSMAHHHVFTKHWPGLVYHFVIAPDGQVYQTQDHKWITWHAANYEVNSRSISLCLIGNFQEQKPPIAQVQALHKLVAYLNNALKRRLTINWHRATKKDGYTDCPGEHLIQILKKIQDPLTLKYQDGYKIGLTDGYKLAVEDITIAIQATLEGLQPASTLPQHAKPHKLQENHDNT